jgi:hypothetical protein
MIDLTGAKRTSTVAQAKMAADRYQLLKLTSLLGQSRGSGCTSDCAGFFGKLLAGHFARFFGGCNLCMVSATA